VSLARFWAEGGQRRQAHKLLASIRDWFSEGHATQDLTEANSLLEALD
jgi:hypothetical protein